MEQGYITASEPVQGTVLSMLKIIKLAAPYSTKHIHTVSKKYTTQPPAIILTAVADSSNFWYKYHWENMWPKGGLFSHLICLVYISDLGKL